MLDPEHLKAIRQGRRTFGKSWPMATEDVDLLLTHIDALAAELADERALADTLAVALRTAATIYDLTPSEGVAAALARHRAARQPNITGETG